MTDLFNFEYTSTTFLQFYYHLNNTTYNSQLNIFHFILKINMNRITQVKNTLIKLLFS